MNCPTDGVLRAGFDHALDESEQKALDAHVSGCASCRERAEALGHKASQTQRAFSALDPMASEVPSDSRVALARFRTTLSSFTPEPSFARRLLAFRPKPIWGGAVAALAVVATFLVFPGARGWAQDILGLLRVEKVTVVQFDRSALWRGENQAAAAKLISGMLSDQVVTDADPGKPMEVASADDAARSVGFRVRTLSGLSAQPHFRVHGEAAYRMTVDIDRVHAILDETGRSDIAIPRALDGATISVRIPKSVYSGYGDCPRWDTEDETAAHRPRHELGGDCTVLIQAPSPTVIVPPELNIQELAEAGLQFSGMTAPAAHEFAQTVDWRSTLVIPVPRDTVSTETVDIDGVKGTLLTGSRWGGRGAARSSVIWIKNGIVHALLGPGSAEDVLALTKKLD
jgi:hypothetical protein